MTKTQKHEEPATNPLGGFVLNSESWDLQIAWNLEIGYWNLMRLVYSLGQQDTPRRRRLLFACLHLASGQKIRSIQRILSKTQEKDFCPFLGELIYE